MAVITTGNAPEGLSGGRRMGKSWMQPGGSGTSVVKHPGALRETAKRMGLAKGDAPLSANALAVMAEKGGATTRKRVGLARAFRHAHHGAGARGAYQNGPQAHRS